MKKITALVSFFVVVVVVILSGETSILSRLSIILQFQLKRAEPSPKPMDFTPSGKVIPDALQPSHHTPAKGNDSTISEKRLENKTHDSGVQNGGRRHVIIMANTRTGSSFVGELFNQQKESVFYLFEPLWHLLQRYSLLSDQINWKLMRAFQDVLKGLYRCDFSTLEKYIQPAPKNHVTPVFFRRESSYSLCEDPVCSPVGKRQSPSVGCRDRHCGPLNLTLASKSCQSKQNVVIKTVRVEQLDTLKPLVEDPYLDLKIIQLVRDPRAKLVSNLVTFSTGYKTMKAMAADGEEHEENIEIKLKENCDRIRASAAMALSRPPWLKNNYMLVRFEDVARDPVKMAEEMLKFAGIPFSPKAREWILANTQSSDEQSNAFSTKRNSSQQADKWRLKLPFPVVQVVQKVCKPTMELFGYRFVDDEKTLLNTSISLLGEISFN